MLGSLAGSALFPTQLPPGPQISDNRTTTAVVGVPVPLLFGTANVAGTVIHLGPIITDTVTESSGSSGPEQKLFLYSQTIAYGLCMRVDETAADNVPAIGGITRIWENGTIVFDIRPQLDANPALNLLAETDDAYRNRLRQSALYAETFVLHYGDELQVADPTLEELAGAGEVPAHRGLAYVVYPQRALPVTQGWRHPNMQFECYQYGTGDCTDSPELSNAILYPWIGTATENPTNPLNVNTYFIKNMDQNAANFGDFVPKQNTIYSSLGDALGAGRGFYGFGMGTFMGYALLPYDDYGNISFHLARFPFNLSVVNHPDARSALLYYNYEDPSYGDKFYDPPSTIPFYVPLAVWFQTTKLYKTTTRSDTVDSAPPLIPPYLTMGRWGGGGYWFNTIDSLIIRVTREPAPPKDPCYGLEPALIPGYSKLPNGKLVKCGPWTLDTTRTFLVLRAGIISAGNRLDPPQNPCTLLSDPINTEEFWTAAYNAAVAAGKMPSGWTYTAGGAPNGNRYPQLQYWAYARDLVVCEGAGAAANVSDIISAVCRRAGLTQVDVSELQGITVDGYAISTVCSGSAILTPLRSVAFFDVVESGNIVRFKARGGAVVRTLTSDDFGAYEGGNSDVTNVPPAITTVHAQEEDLPRSIRLHYLSTARDYQDGEADSLFRLNSKAVNDVDVSVAICLNDTQALRCASVLWADALAASVSHELAVDQGAADLEAGDCIGVPVDGFTKRMRIVSDSNASGILRKLSCVTDDDDAYISYAVAQPPASVSPGLKFIAQSSAEYLDLPALRDADDDPGFYVANQRNAGEGNGWLGGVNYKSTDGGDSFALLFALNVEATIGALSAAVPASQALTWDDETVIAVDVPEAFSFESVSDDAVIAGANAAAMGADRRWEIVQFANATQVTATRWELSRLLRGRRGTEWTLGLSQAGDVLVMVSAAGDIARVALNLAQLGAAAIYKVVSVGRALSTGIETTFAGHGQALVPFSPCALAATRVGDDIHLTWLRRNRLGRTLMSGVDIPMSEASLSFQVDILSEASPPVVLRTLSVNATEALYTAAEQIEDFGAALPLASVSVRIYQMSASVGRGSPASEVLTII